jgi:sigma-E factor negative regulatory protein RseC
MLEACGIVVSTEHGAALVRSQRQSVCDGCAGSGGCPLQLWRLVSRAGADDLLRAGNALGAKPGERVRIGIADGALGRALGVSLGFPLMGLVVGAASAGVIAPGDLAAAVGGGAGFLLGAGWAWRVGRAPKGRKILEPMIVAIMA